MERPDAGTSPDAPRNRIPPTINRDLDLLFVIDDSVSMEPLQAKMRARLPDFINLLRRIPGGLPDMQIAVVTTSLGAGIFGNVPGCAPGTVGNRDGAFQHRADCQALPADQHFLRSIAGQSNFTGDIADVLTCITDVGAMGCGFEHQFESTRVALQRALDPADPANGGFLRPNAYLAIVMLTNEDDCSVDATSTLFDPRQQSVVDPLGGLQSYRCSEFGHVCDGLAPPHAVTEFVTLDNCVSAEDRGPLADQERLTTVASFVEFLQGLKANPEQILVAAIAGPVAPYSVEPHTFTLENGALESQPRLVHSCMQSPTEYAYPAIRIAAWLHAFGSNGIFQSVCADDLQPAMQAIADAIAKKIGRP